MADPARLTGVAGSLVLVRHGETTWIAEGRFQGRSDPPLSELGERQAERVAARLAAPDAGPALPIPRTGPIGVWHSPLGRAASVARAIATARPAPLTTITDLSELDQGAWEGLTHAEVGARYPAELAAWRRDPVHHHAPGGESAEMASVRARRAADRLLDELRRADARDGAWLVVVAHDGLLRLLLLDLLGLPLSAFWSFPFGLCAVSVVEIGAGVGRLRAHNLADHLDGLRPSAPGGLPQR